MLYVLSQFWSAGSAYWLAQLLGTLAPVLGLAFLSTGLGLLLQRQWVAGTLAVALWLGLNGTSLFSLRATPEPAPHVERLRVLTLNASPEHTSPATLGLILDLVEQEGIEVIAWQEAPLQVRQAKREYSGAAPLLALLARSQHWAPRPDVNGEAARPRHMVANPVTSSLEWGGCEEGKLDSPAEELYQSSYTRALLQWGGEEIAVYNVHLASYTGWRPWKDPAAMLKPSRWAEAVRSIRSDLAIRRTEAIELRALLAEEERPYLVVGDLNSTPQQEVYRIVSEGLTDAFSAVGRGFGLTFHSAVPFVRLDYVFASPEWDIVRAEVLPEVASDHRALLVELSLNHANSEGATAKRTSDGRAP